MSYLSLLLKQKCFHCRVVTTKFCKTKTPCLIKWESKPKLWELFTDFYNWLTFLYYIWIKKIVFEMKYLQQILLISYPAHNFVTFWAWLAFAFSIVFLWHLQFVNFYLVPIAWMRGGKNLAIQGGGKSEPIYYYFF